MTADVLVLDAVPHRAIRTASPPPATAAVVHHLERVRPGVERAVGGTFAFGPFVIDTVGRTLSDGDTPVRLGGRAFDLLAALVLTPGELVAHQALIARVWPGQQVEENTLRVHMSALRKALGDGQPEARCIQTVSGRGYVFVAPLRRVHADPPAPKVNTRWKLPSRLSRMVGRADSVQAVGAGLAASRLVTIVGPGGMGKTTVALAVGDAMGHTLADGAWLVDLSTLDPTATEPDIAAAFCASLEVSSTDASVDVRLLNHLAGKSLLLIVDNCEHVLDVLGPLLERLLQGAPHLHVLATSREALHMGGERVHRLAALSYPAAAPVISAAQARAYPAVELLVERLVAADDHFALDDHNAAALSSLCRRLDGNPLAIEFVAGMVRTLGLRELLAVLDHWVLRSAQARRAASPRHHTLVSMMEWSWRLLSPLERRVLGRLSIFRSGMRLDGALAVAADGPADKAEVHEVICGLVSKSWLIADVSADPARLHMHLVPRRFAETRWELSGETNLVRARHAAHMEAIAAAARQDWGTCDMTDWIARYTPESSDVRAAVEHLLAQADIARAADLLGDAWIVGYLSHEYGTYEALALRVLDELTRHGIHELGQLKLQRALMWLTGPLVGPAPSRTDHGRRALELAERTGHQLGRVEALMAGSMHALVAGDFMACLDHAQRASEALQGLDEPIARVVVDKMLAQGHHYVGHLVEARTRAERVLASPVRRAEFGSAAGPLAHQVSMRIVLARTLWLQGFADRAWAECQQLRVHAERESVMAQCQAIGLALLPIAVWRGDSHAASHLAIELLTLSRRHSLDSAWEPWARSVEVMRVPDPAAKARFAHDVSYLLLVDHLATFDGAFLGTAAIERSGAGEAAWCRPELLRRRADALLATGGPAARHDAEGILLTAAEIARASGALAWELRCAISLHRLHGVADSERELRAVMERFSEGLETADLREARQLLG